MKRGRFEIWCVGKDEIPFAKEVKGYYSGIFGVHKEGGSYTVTHLPTGCWMARFALLKSARKFVDLIEKETWPVPWDSSENSLDYAPNHNKIIVLRGKALEA